MHSITSGAYNTSARVSGVKGLPSRVNSDLKITPSYRLGRVRNSVCVDYRANRRYIHGKNRVCRDPQIHTVLRREYVPTKEETDFVH